VETKTHERVILEQAYQIFGEWNFASLFQADTNENALHFVGDIVCPIEGATTTYTLPMAPVKKHRKS
jgi:uncharacterized protein with GYD domain